MKASTALLFLISGVALAGGPADHRSHGNGRHPHGNHHGNIHHDNGHDPSSVTQNTDVDNSVRNTVSNTVHNDVRNTNFNLNENTASARQQQGQQQQQTQTANGGNASATGGNSSSTSSLTVAPGAVTAQGGQGGAGGQGGQGGSANSSSNSSVGDVKPTQTVSINQVYKQIPNPAGVATPETPYNQLYDLSAITAEKGIDLNLAYEDICKPKTTVNSPGDINDKDKRKEIQFYFIPHQDFREGGRKETVADPNFPKDGARVDCLGLLQADSISSGNPPYEYVASQARMFAARHFREYDHVYLVTMRDVIAANRGVSSRSGAWNVLPAISKIFGGGAGLGSAGGGLARNNGRTYTGVRVGTTFLVFADDPNSKLYVTLKTLEPKKPEPKPPAKLPAPKASKNVPAKQPPAKTKTVIIEKKVGFQANYVKPRL